ncbi:hypothetical protein, partial [uncultured Mobiluncus sp.]|uniref:hypothetical protein n=1 Tax=uncultured Mobiluncus sp. TaxID=293425 RepID=UPI00280603DC
FRYTSVSCTPVLKQGNCRGNFIYGYFAGYSPPINPKNISSWQKSWQSTLRFRVLPRNPRQAAPVPAGIGLGSALLAR